MSLESNLDVDAGFLDPASQDHFESVDDQICPEMLTVALPGHTEAGLRLQCEVEGEHDGHEATLRWTTEAKETDDG